MAMITTQCPKKNCNVPARWNYFDSSGVTYRQYNSAIQQKVTVFNGKTMSEVTLSGNYMEDNILLEFAEGSKEKLRVVFYGIISSSSTFRSQYSGYIGLAPYTASIDFREQSLNFMH